MKHITSIQFKDLGPVAYRLHGGEAGPQAVKGYLLDVALQFETCDPSPVWIPAISPLEGLLSHWFHRAVFVGAWDQQADVFRELEGDGTAIIREIEDTGPGGIAEFVIEFINVFLRGEGHPPDQIHCVKVSVKEHSSASATRGECEESGIAEETTFSP